METRQQVNTFLVEYQCDECKEGTMESIGMILPSSWGGDSTKDSPKWSHKCDTCGTGKNLDTRYPYPTYEYY